MGSRMMTSFKNSTAFPIASAKGRWPYKLIKTPSFIITPICDGKRNNTQTVSPSVSLRPNPNASFLRRREPDGSTAPSSEGAIQSQIVLYLRDNYLDLAPELCALDDTVDENADKSITEIAYDAGFGTTRTFNHCFIAARDVSPKEYRKSRRKQ